jgi:outer membrane lipoprotein-sorting protein
MRSRSTACLVGAGLALAVVLAAPRLYAEKSPTARTPIPTASSALSLASRAARFPPVESARAQFSQEREVSLVDEVLHARGTLALKAPDSMRLELTEPERITILADGTTVTVLDSNGQPVPLPPEMSGFGQFGRSLNELMLGRKAPEQFTERWENRDTVTLVPESAAAPFSEITLRFPPDRPLPAEIVLRERNGDRTTIRMEALEVTTAASPTTAPAQ